MHFNAFQIHFVLCRIVIYVYMQSNGNALEERERKVTILESHEDLCRANTKGDEA